MSSYRQEDEICAPEEVVLIYDSITGRCVYAFCTNHQDEYVYPLYAFNLEYFRQVRDNVIEKAKEEETGLHVAVPHHFITNKVVTSEESLAEHLFGLEVSNE